jgi:sugar phosphate isomerase/epimerase
MTMSPTPIRSFSRKAASRRHFLQSIAVAGAGLAAGLSSLRAAEAAGAAAVPPLGIKLGFDNFSIRGLGWNAGRILDYAATLKVDSVIFSDLKVYESHDDGYLKELKAKADGLGISIQAGTYSICPTSKSCTKDYGTPEEHLALGLRVAKAVGSSVLRCVLGNGDDRKVEGGIEKQIAETVKVLKNVRGKALDAGVKIAVENHAGDMQATELVGLIEAAGRDFVGATTDSGNATWTLEAPMENLEILGPYTLTTGMRDSMIWDTPEGAVVQWTAIGEGAVDFKAYVKRYAQLCPNAPFQLEIISGFQRPFPYLKADFWKPYPKVLAKDFAPFLALARKGHAIDTFKAPAGVDRKVAEQDYQKAELERSVRYCREALGLGLKT